MGGCPSIAVLDASDNSMVAELVPTVDGRSGDWERVRKRLPEAALGKIIVIEFRFASDDFGNFAGWYLDDLERSLFPTHPLRT